LPYRPVILPCLFEYLCCSEPGISAIKPAPVPWSAFEIDLFQNKLYQSFSGTNYPFLVSPQFFIASMLKSGEYSKASLLFWKTYKLPSKLYKADIAINQLIAAMTCVEETDNSSSSSSSTSTITHPFRDIEHINSSEGQTWGWNHLRGVCKDL
jgi:hypothetical protein